METKYCLHLLTTLTGWAIHNTTRYMESVDIYRIQKTTRNPEINMESKSQYGIQKSIRNRKKGIDEEYGASIE